MKTSKKKNTGTNKHIRFRQNYVDWFQSRDKRTAIPFILILSAFFFSYIRHISNFDQMSFLNVRIFNRGASNKKPFTCELLMILFSSIPDVYILLLLYYKQVILNVCLIADRYIIILILRGGIITKTIFMLTDKSKTFISDLISSLLCRLHPAGAFILHFNSRYRADRV